MSDHDAKQRRYAALSDRLALGERLAPDEHAFVLRMQETDPACRLEADLLENLGDLDVAPNEQTRALVDAVLGQIADGGARDEVVTVQPRHKARSLSRRWAVAGSCAAVAAAVLLYLSLSGRDGRPTDVSARIELVYLSGDITVGDAPTLSSSRLLVEGDVLTVRTGSACIAMDPEINVCAKAGARLQLTSVSAAMRRLDLLEGKIAVQLATQPEGSRLSIVSDGVWSTAVGTAFTVERSAEHGVQTTVLHGKVRVGESDRHSKLVSAHQRARTANKVGAARVTEVVAVSRSDESQEWALLGPTKLWNTAVSATLEISGAPGGAEVALDGQLIGIAPLSTLVPAGLRQIDVRSGGQSLWSGERALTAGEREEISLAGIELGGMDEDVDPATFTNVEAPRAAAAAEPAKRRAAAKPAVATSSELLREARTRLRPGQLDAAAPTYGELIKLHPASAEARSSLLSLAELELEHLGNARAALDYANRYLASGGGALAPEARETRVRALRSLGRRAEERVAIEEYLRVHPTSLRASTLANRLAELGGEVQREPSGP